MLSTHSFAFRRNLAANNTKAWFEEHRANYDELHAELTEAAGELLGRSASFDKDLPADALDPAGCVSRIHRDMRFAQGKPLFKTDQFIMLNAAGTGDQNTSSYYVHVEPGRCYAGGGMFTPSPLRAGGMGAAP